MKKKKKKKKRILTKDGWIEYDSQRFATLNLFFNSVIE